MNNIRIVLVNTTHAGNIGATARAMKTMGLSRLYLVAPKQFPDAAAIAMAAGAADVLQQAVVVNSLQQAIADCHLVFASSARVRACPWPMLSPRVMAEKIFVEKESQVALLFGRESSGLSNAELQHAHYHVQIPSSADYTALNVAQAVQVLCYEVRVAFSSLSNDAGLHDMTCYADTNTLADFYQHLEQLLIEVNFIDIQKPRQQMQKLRRLFARTRLALSEVQLLRGALSDIQRALDNYR